MKGQLNSYFNGIQGGHSLTAIEIVIIIAIDNTLVDHRVREGCPRSERFFSVKIQIAEALYDGVSLREAA